MELVEAWGGQNVSIVQSPVVARPTTSTGFYQQRGKRIFDLALAGVLIVVMAPIFLLAAASVLLASGWPIQYRSRRAGRGGHEFWMPKFRTMRSDADERLAELIARAPEVRLEFALRRKLNDDPRVTPLGRTLRSLSIDELPQLMSVVFGHMSLVGPRPVPRDELHAMYGPLFPYVISVRPGITGLWQVNGRNRTTYEERVKYDVQYSAHVSFAGDLRILASTVSAVLRRDGAQ